MGSNFLQMPTHSSRSLNLLLVPGRAGNTVTLQGPGLAGKIMHSPKFPGFPAGLECSWLLPKQQHTWVR